MIILILEILKTRKKVRFIVEEICILFFYKNVYMYVEIILDEIFEGLLNCCVMGIFSKCYCVYLLLN